MLRLPNADDVDDALASVRDVVVCIQQMSRLESMMTWEQIRSRATAAARDLCCAATTLQAVLSNADSHLGDISQDVLEDAALLTHQLRCFQLPIHHECTKIAQDLEGIAVLTACGLLPMNPAGCPQLDAAWQLLYRQQSDRQLATEGDLLLKKAAKDHQDSIHALVLRSVALLQGVPNPAPCSSFSRNCIDWPRRSDPQSIYVRALAITAKYEQGLSLVEVDGCVFDDEFIEGYTMDFVEFWEQDDQNNQPRYETQSERLAVATTNAVRVLCRDPVLRRKAAVAGCVAPLARFLHRFQRSQQLLPIAATRALANLVLAGEGCRREAERYGVVNSLIAMLACCTDTMQTQQVEKKSIDMTVRYAIEALANLGANSETLQREIIKSKPDLFAILTQRILECSDETVDNGSDLLLTSTFRLIRNLTSRCPANRYVAAKGSGLIPAIATKIISMTASMRKKAPSKNARWLLLALASVCEGCPPAAEEAADIPDLLDALLLCVDSSGEVQATLQSAAVIALSHILTVRHPLPTGWTPTTVAAALVGVLRVFVQKDAADCEKDNSRLETGESSPSVVARAAALCMHVLADMCSDREAFGRIGAPQILCQLIAVVESDTRAWHPAVIAAALKGLCTLFSGRCNANRNLVLTSKVHARRLASSLVGLILDSFIHRSFTERTAAGNISKRKQQHYKRDAVRVLSMLCSVRSEEKAGGATVFVDTVVNAGGIQALVRICKSSQESRGDHNDQKNQRDEKEAAATALSNLACIPDLHPAMLAAECVPPLLSMLSPTSPIPHRRSAACCLANLVAEGTIPSPIRRELSQTVADLVSLADLSIDASAASAAVGALGNLACAGKSGIEMVLRKGGIEALAKLVGSPTPAVREAAVQGLWECCRSVSSRPSRPSPVAEVMISVATHRDSLIRQVANCSNVDSYFDINININSNSISNSIANSNSNSVDLIPALVHALRVAGSLATATAAAGCLATILSSKGSDLREKALGAGAQEALTGRLLMEQASLIQDGLGNSTLHIATIAEVENDQRRIGGNKGEGAGEDAGLEDDLQGELNRLVAEALLHLTLSKEVETEQQFGLVESRQLQTLLQLPVEDKSAESGFSETEKPNSNSPGLKRCFSMDQDSMVSCLVQAT